MKKFEGIKENPEAFREYLGAVALRIYNGENEWITSDELNDMDETERFIEECRLADVQDALKEVLISFYFRPVENTDVAPRDRRYSVEFFHKSLQEYLAAEHIWRTVLDKFTAKEDRRKRYIIDKAEDGLEVIWELGSYRGLTVETSAYLREIIDNDTDEDRKDDLFQRLHKFMFDFIRHDFVYLYVAGHDKTGSAIARGVESFYLFWTIFSKIRSYDMVHFGVYKRQFINLINFKVRNNNDYLNCSNLDLLQGDFRGLELNVIDFSNSRLIGGNFSGSVLHFVKFIGTDLRDCSFNRCFINSVDYTSAKISYADFSQSLNYHINFEKVRGTEIDFTESYFEDCNFKNAHLENSQFVDSTGIECDFKWAVFSKTILANTKLELFEFSNTTISNSVFANSDIINSDFSNSNITESKFIKANLKGCSFHSTKISKSDFEQANLEDADFTAAEIEEDALKNAVNIDKIFRRK